ncbi:MAG: hypothetical protein G01um101431_789 [Parcubacteria group bacterium Gr01-1014_31]|nr:MAG: hypothetical protein G01um101431_789 [Parcubacteria group bacterium Gr01-1014_31]
MGVVARARSLGWLALPLVTVIAVFSPVLFFGRVFADGDAVLQFYPILTWLQRALRAGQSVDFNPHVLAGFPTAASTLGGLRSPLQQWLFGTFDVITVYAWLTGASFLLTALCTYGLARALGFGRPAAALPALVVPLSPALLGFAGNITVSVTYWTFPALLLCVWHLHRSSVRQARWWVSVAGGALIFAHSLQVGHLQWPLVYGTAAFAFAVALFWRERRWQTLAGTTALFAAAAVLALPLLLPTLAFARLSARLHSGASGEGGLRLLDLSSWLLPRVVLPRLTSTPGFLYAGALPFLLAVVGLRLRDWRVRVAWWGLLGSLLLAWSGSPLAWFVNRLPVFSLFRASARWMYVGNVATAFLAAAGLDFIIAHANGAWRPLAQRVSSWTMRAVAVLAGLSAVWLAAAAPLRTAAFALFDRYWYARTTGLPVSHYHQVLDGMLSQFASGVTIWSFPTALGIVSLAAAAWLLRRVADGRIGGAVFAALALALTAGNLAPLAFSALPTADARVLRVAPGWSVPPGERFFSFLPGSSVYQQLDVPFGYAPDDNIALHRALGSANLQLLDGSDGLDYYDNIMDRRSARVLSYLGSNRGTTGEQLATLDVSFEEKRALFLERLPMLAALNVGTVVSLYPLSHPDLALVATLDVTTRQLPLYVYRLTTVQPRFYFAPAVQATPAVDATDAWQAFLDHQPRLSNAVLLECADCPMSTATGTVQVLEASTARYRFAVRAAAEAWFIFGYANLPGWTAALDGVPAAHYPANYLLQAVRVPQGDHQLEFTYSLDRAWRDILTQ